MSKSATFETVRLIDLAGIAATVCLSFGAYWVAALPVITQRDIRTAQIKELINLTASEQDQIAQRASSEKALERLKIDLAKCEVIPVSVSALNTRIMELGELATESGLEVETVKGEDAKALAQRVHVPIKLIARGPYFSVARFLKDLSVKFRDTAVERFMVTADRSDNGGEQGLAQIDLTWYAVSEGASDLASAPNP